MEGREDSPARAQDVSQGGVTEPLTPPVFVTRRARACGCQVEGASDRDPAAVLAISPSVRGVLKVHVYATMGDIGDPRWRMWLVSGIRNRVEARQIEIHVVG